MARQIKVFVCSPTMDLERERQVVINSILSTSAFVNAMEFFSATPGTPLEVCLRKIDESSLVIVIVGRQYGSLVPGSNISFSEAEYNHAVGSNKPCLVFMTTDDQFRNAIISDPAMLRLQAWRSTLLSNNVVARFDSAETLSAKLSGALCEQLLTIEKTAAAMLVA